MICKKGIDKALVLVNELHAAQDLPDGTQMNLEMKNGPRLFLSALFVQRPSDYGPSAYVQVYGNIYTQNGKLIKNFSHEDLIIALGETKSVFYEYEGQRIEISILPEVR